MNFIRSAVTVVLFVLYVLLLWRSYRRQARADFSAAAQLPFEGESADAGAQSGSP
jgi:cbb3-type cytochrome oxidase subunit 3